MKDLMDLFTRELISKRGRPKSGTAVPGQARTRAWRERQAAQRACLEREATAAQLALLERQAAQLAADPNRPISSELIDLSALRPWHLA